MKRALLLEAGATVLLLTAVALSAAGKQATQPPTPTIPHDVRTEFGAVRNDPYFWLRDDTRSNPRIIAHLNAENAYTDAILAPVQGLRSAVQKELEDRVPAQEASVPFLENGYWYYTRFSPGENYPVIARKKGDLGAPEEIVLDEVQRARHGGFFSITKWVISPDTRFLAWTEDRVGRFQYELHVKNLATGQILEEFVTGTSPNILWGGDSRTILYVINNKELRPEYLEAHVVGTPVSQDRLLYDETDDTFYSWLIRTNDRQYVCLDGFSLTNTEWRCAPLQDPTRFRVIERRQPGHIYDVDHAGNRWFIRTNQHAPNYKIVELEDCDRKRGQVAWKSVVPASEDALLEGMRAFPDFMAIEQRSKANRQILIRVADGKVTRIPANEAAYTMSLADEQVPDGRWVRYDYESLVTPAITEESNIDSGERRILRSRSVPGYDPSRYVTERAWVTARDGARIPVSLLHKREWKRDGSAGIVQFAYGAYGISVDAKFTDYAVSVADRGAVFAIAHVRGGQEMGRTWYDQGHFLRKINTFNDFVDATRGLVAQRYAAKGRVVAMGASGGGALMGAIANMAPDDYRGVVAIVPYVDAVTTMLDPSIPLVTREYTEWGNPHHKPEYEYMLSWSPYDNVGHHSYPAMYVWTGFWDSQVQYFEPAKWVAKLRAAKAGDAPVILRVEMQGGHLGPGGRYQQARVHAEYMAFALWELGYRK